jgi:hypothetical protein
MSVFDFGDFHGNSANEKDYLSEQVFPEQLNLTKDDTLIINGDVGLLRYFPYETKYSKDIDNRNWIASRNYTTLCIMGNHENWKLYYDLPIIQKWNGNVRVLNTDFGEIYFAITGEVYIIDSKTFFVVNGALSPNKDILTLGIDWFEEESISYKDTFIVESKAKEIKEVDFLLTHTCNADIVPYFIQNSGSSKLSKYRCRTSEFLAYLDTILDYKENLFGHFHIQKTIQKDGKTYSCFYKTKPRKII